MRYIVTIRKKRHPVGVFGGTPVVYYLSKNGFRCYTPENVAVFKAEQVAREQRDHFAALMKDYELTVERLPANVRNVWKAVLSAVPV